MTPASAIASLDRQLALHGQAVTLMRGDVATPDNTAALTAFVRGKRREDMEGGASQTVRDVILSPTGLVAASWPDVPKKGDWLTAEGVTRALLEVEVIRFGGSVIRYELKVKG